MIEAVEMRWVVRTVPAERGLFGNPAYEYRVLQYRQVVQRQDAHHGGIIATGWMDVLEMREEETDG